MPSQAPQPWWTTCSKPTKSTGRHSTVKAAPCFAEVALFDGVQQTTIVYLWDNVNPSSQVPAATVLVDGCLGKPASKWKERNSSHEVLPVGPIPTFYAHIVSFKGKYCSVTSMW